MTTYTLEVPASNEAICQLMQRILEENPDQNHRVQLHFGTAALTCLDEEERAEHGTNVTVRFVLEVLEVCLSRNAGDG